jgi:drug/metabolite transporter (DMT)-like permease
MAVPSRERTHSPLAVATGTDAGCALIVRASRPRICDSGYCTRPRWELALSADFSTTSYTTICYGVCAILLLVVCLAGGVPTTGFAAASWLAILGLAAGPQLLGHSMFNYALRRISATTVSVTMLLEVPGAALLAWVWLGQAPRPAALPGLALLLAGVAVVILGGQRAGAKVPPPD